MEQKRTLFDYLYQNLREQILTGILPYGAHLPSITQLCDIYNVGVRTSKDVVKALKKEGLIHTEQRRPSIVIYRHPQTGTDNPVYAVLGQRSSILTVYQTMSILMPPLFPFQPAYAAHRNWSSASGRLSMNVMRSGNYGRAILTISVVCWQLRTTCCSEICIQVSKSMPRYPSSGSTGQNSRPPRHMRLAGDNSGTLKL